MRHPTLPPALLTAALTWFASLALAGGAQAHPHIFIATALELQVDAAGDLTGIAVSWSYDEMYSMLLLDELSLDPDYDGVLEPGELAQLDGYDLRWMEGYEGDLYVTAPGGAAVVLGPPESLGVSFTDGVYTSRHLRRPVQPLPAEGLVVKAYDPTLYTAYDLTGGVTVTGNAACGVTIVPHEEDRALKDLAAELAKIPADATEIDFPQVGEKFADAIRVSCGAGH